MEDREFRDLFRDVQDDIGELRIMIDGMRLSDADARADAKVVAGKLDNAAVALANAAQAIQAKDLQGAAISPHEKWMLRIIVGLLALIAALAGIRTLDPSLLKGLAGL